MADSYRSKRLGRFIGASAAVTGTLVVALLVGVNALGLEDGDVSGTDISTSNPTEFAFVMMIVAAAFVGPTLLATSLLFGLDRGPRWPWWIMLAVIVVADAIIALGIVLDGGTSSMFSLAAWTAAMIGIVLAGWRLLASDTWTPRSPLAETHGQSRLQDVVQDPSRPTTDPMGHDSFPPILPNRRDS